MKKRKLNSKNPKYIPSDKREDNKYTKRVLMCTTPNKVKVYALWY